MTKYFYQKGAAALRHTAANYNYCKKPHEGALWAEEPHVARQCPVLS